MKRKAALLGAAVLILAMAATVTVILVSRDRTAVAITLYHPWADEAWQAAISRELREFDALHERYTATAQLRERQEIAAMVGDRGAAKGTVALAVASSAGPDATGIPWSGSFWKLYYNKQVISKAGVDLDAAARDLAGFSAALAAVRRTGVTPIAVGAKFGWPLAVWVQAIMAGEGFPEDAALTSSGVGETTAYTDAIARFRGYIDSNYVRPDAATTDWIDSVLAVSTGKAAFCMTNERLVTSLDAKVRAGLGELPLPGAEGGNWAIGSIAYLVTIGQHSGAERRAGDALIAYLASPGVTSRLSRSLGASFLSEGDRPGELVPSIASTPDADIIAAIRRDVGLER